MTDIILPSLRAPMQPFLKWAGGKRWLRKKFPNLFPRDFTRYFEPFLGSGAVYFDLLPSSAVLSDTNAELISVYQSIKGDWRKVVEHLHCHALKHNDEYYYEVRAKRPTSSEAAAARFLYLNRSCWNGLYRVNLSGEFNVPRGTKDAILLTTDNFEEVSQVLQSTEIKNNDFEVTLELARSGDFVFVDPPYTTAHNLNGFVKYNDRIFSWNDQIRLRDAIRGAAERGAKILLTNADHESVRDIYKGIGQKHNLDRVSVISGTAKGRGATTELAIVIGY